MIESWEIQQGVLGRTSLTHADTIYTLNKSIAVKRFGQLNRENYQEVVQTIYRFIE